MEELTVTKAHPVADDTHVVPTWLPVPGFGFLTINAFLIHAAEPVLIDTGAGRSKDAFLDELERLTDLGHLRWIYLTHTDPDHVGALAELLAAAPEAKVVTTFVGMAKMALYAPVPPERVFLLNPGQSLDVGDRKLVATRPPTYDAPETTALFDSKTGVLFSSDSFGGLLPDVAEEADAVPREALREGMVRWATIDAPWLHLVEPRHVEDALGRVRKLGPSAVLSSHLPPAHDLVEVLLENVAAARTATPFVGPDQEAMLASAGAPADSAPGRPQPSP